MDPGDLMRTCLIIASICACVVKGSPVGTSTINCASGSDLQVGEVDEGFTGDVEVLNGIEAGNKVMLVPHILHFHLEFLELSFTVGDTSATVRTKKPLDADVLSGSGGSLYYSIMCDDHGKVNNIRRLKVKDINDNGPVFQQKSYTKDVPETHPVDTSVLHVMAIDGDGSPENRAVTYSAEPASDDFEFTTTGVFYVKRQLNYNLVQKYNFVVTAKDKWGLSDTAIVEFNVVDVDNLNPVFSHGWYRALIPENQVGSFRTIEPEAIKAQDGDTGINAKLTYSISAVTPDVYLTNFIIDTSSGVISVATAFDREEVNSSLISISIKAAQTDDNSKTADATVSVTIDDVNEAPEFDQPKYIINVQKNLPNNAVVLKAIVPDWNQNAMVTNVKDNRPEFSSIGYVSSILLKDAEKGKLLLTLSATDRDTGENARITYSFSEGTPPYLALNHDTGAVTLTSDLSDVTGDKTLKLTAVATDHGRPPLNATVPVVVNLRVASIVEGVAFLRPSYDFSIPENEEGGATLGRVQASAGSDVYEVAYKLKTHSDLFSMDTSGTIATKAELDKEKQELYILEVEAVDTRTPPTSATAVVRVHVDDVNEPPQFQSEVYKAAMFSSVVYDTSIIWVKATDPDVGENGRLSYSLSESSHFDVDPSSGLVYVVSVNDLSGQTEVLEVKATDGGGLQATTRVEVEVRGDASSGDVVTISLNQPANVVEKKVVELEKCLGSVLNWTVYIVQVSSSDGESTLVSFISADGDKVVSSKEVIKKLKSQSAAVTIELVKLFGEGTNFAVVTDSLHPAIIAVSVVMPLVALTVIFTIATVTIIIRDKKKGLGRSTEEDRVSIDVGPVFFR